MVLLPSLVERCKSGFVGGYAGAIGIEIRGSTSARDFSKKSYSLETRNDQGEDVDTAFFGMAAESDWVLYGPEHDRSLGLRNALTFALAQNLTVFAPETRFVELFLTEDNSALRMEHYKGLYILMEKIKRGKHRVDISSGGSILKHDNNNIDPGDQYFRLKESGLDMIVVYPKKKNLKPHHLSYLKEHLETVEAAMFSNTSSALGSFLDVGSFVDYFLITELTKNPDGYRGSTYLHLDSDGVVKMGPVWDYNEAYGLCCGYPIEGYFEEGHSDGVSGGSAISPNGWRFNICSEPRRCLVDPLDGVSQWYRALWTDASIRAATRQRWSELRQKAFSDANVRGIIATLKAQIAVAAQRNNAQWSDVVGSSDGESTLREIQRIEDWTLDRLSWMDSQLTLPESTTVPDGLQGFATVTTRS